MYPEVSAERSNMTKNERNLCETFTVQPTQNPPKQRKTENFYIYIPFLKKIGYNGYGKFYQIYGGNQYVSFCNRNA